MRCGHCRGVMVQSRHEVLDQRDHLTIRTWRCGRCGDLMEELRIAPANGRGDARRIQYDVRPWSIVPRSMRTPTETEAEETAACGPPRGSQRRGRTHSSTKGGIV